MFYSSQYASPIGTVLIASDGRSLTGLWLEGQKYLNGSLVSRLCPRDELPLFTLTKNWLDQYFSGHQPSISSLPLAAEGSAFRREVWGLLCQIPYGTTMTYGEIAKIMAQRTNKARMSSQAVGGAVGHNPISIIIPCHRVVGANGNLTGYAGGIVKKLKLLEHEGVDCSGLYMPKQGTAL